jgi:uncharacterized protein YkwD
MLEAWDLVAGGSRGMRVVRTRRTEWIALALLVLLAFLATGFAPPRDDAAADEPAAGITWKAEETAGGHRREFLALTNRDRAERDRGDVRLERAVSGYAMRHSREMADLGIIFHSTDDELRRALGGTGWSVAGENVGVGDSLEGLQAAFMQSSHHRRNLLSGSFDRAAIGIVVAYDRVWITVVLFGD